MDPGTFAYPVSAELASVLAEAASGFINDGNIYLVASYQPLASQPLAPYNVTGPYATYGDALIGWIEMNGGEIIEGQPTTYGMFGPFGTQVADLPPAVSGQASVTSFQVGTSAGTSFPISPADKYDAIFYSVAAVLKFAVPYYTSVYGTAYAQQMLENFQENDLGMMVHLPWTEYTEMTQAGRENPPVPTGPTDVAPETGPAGAGVPTGYTDQVVFFDRHGNIHSPPPAPVTGATPP
jgi:hypothetical protein